METYLLVAGAFQAVVNPMMIRTRPCVKAVDESSGNPNSKIAAKGMDEPALICDNTILPELGNFWDKKSPIHPPNNDPNEAATINKVQRVAVVTWEKPISSNQSVAKDKPDQGNDPNTP